MQSSQKLYHGVLELHPPFAHVAAQLSNADLERVEARASCTPTTNASIVSMVGKNIRLFVRSVIGNTSW